MAIAEALGIGAQVGGALASIGTGIFNSVQQSKANKQNMQLQKQTYNLQRDNYEWNKQMAERDFEYNKQLQERIFQREDSAMQRQVADNRAAGLSPLANLGGSAAGQALESSTPQVGATFDTPQMSANQLSTDFSSLSSLGSSILSNERSKDQMKLENERLDLEKSSNEYNLKLMEQRIEESKLSNQFARATMESRIAGLDLNNEYTAKNITKLSYDTVGSMLSNKGKEIMNVRSQKELEEWIANAGLRDEMGKAILENNKFSLDEKKARLAMAYILNDDQHQINLSQLSILGENLKKLRDDNQTNFSLKHALESLGVSGETAGAYQHLFNFIEGLSPSNWNIFSK